ncbi:exonuclease SbcD [Lachnospiraceae bacterium KM106-2]|nr:exonuclease SbcD [Lachnospiraceae bacterium KM106-2]
MKFVHIADVHMGMKPDMHYPWGKEREREIEDTFYRVIEFCNEKKAELLLIAGDLFHKQPSAKQLEQIGYLLSKLNNTEVVIMAGNHDYAGYGCAYLNYNWGNRIHFLEPGKLQKIYLSSLHTYIYGQSYQQNNIREDIYAGIEPGSEPGFHILLAHGGDKNNVPFDLVKMKKKKFDYIALGHIHKPQRLSENMAYSGSLEPLDKTETGKHGFIYGELDDLGFKLQFVDAASRRYIPLELVIDSKMNYYEIFDLLKERIRQNGNRNIYLVKLKGKRAIDSKVDTNRLMQAGNIIELIDQTEPDYDYDEIYHENKNNIIGLYLEEAKNAELKDTVKKKAINYGLEALLLSYQEQK